MGVSRASSPRLAAREPAPASYRSANKSVDTAPQTCIRFSLTRHKSSQCPISCEPGEGGALRPLAVHTGQAGDLWRVANHPSRKGATAIMNFPKNYCPESADRVDGEANTNLARDLFAFNGRICRQKFWLMGMVISLMTVAFAVCVSFVSAGVAFLSGSPTAAFAMFFIISLIWIIPLWWMYLAVGAKRWHDRGKSGWWNLIALIPIIGTIWALIELGFLKGDYGYNRYGGEDVSSSETVAKWTFWVSLAFAAILFSVGIWMGSRDELIDGWGALLYAFLIGYATQLLYPTVGSLIIWLMSRR